MTALAFSPDSTKIAVGQSDNIIYVYRIGDKWYVLRTCHILLKLLDLLYTLGERRRWYATRFFFRVQWLVWFGLSTKLPSYLAWPMERWEWAGPRGASLSPSTPLNHTRSLWPLGRHHKHHDIVHEHDQCFQPCVCVFSSPTGDGVISGHADGKIVRYMFQDEHARVSCVCGVCVCVCVCVCVIQTCMITIAIYNIVTYIDLCC